MSTKVTIITEHGNIEACFPRHTTAKEVINFVIKHCDYPEEGKYSLSLLNTKKQGLDLDFNKTISEGNVKDGDNLIFSCITGSV